MQSSCPRPVQPLDLLAAPDGVAARPQELSRGLLLKPPSLQGSSERIGQQGSEFGVSENALLGVFSKQLGL